MTSSTITSEQPTPDVSSDLLRAVELEIGAVGCDLFTFDFSEENPQRFVKLSERLASLTGAWEAITDMESNLRDVSDIKDVRPLTGAQLVLVIDLAANMLSGGIAEQGRTVDEARDLLARFDAVEGLRAILSVSA